MQDGSATGSSLGALHAQNISKHSVGFPIQDDVHVGNKKILLFLVTQPQLAVAIYIHSASR